MKKPYFLLMTLLFSGVLFSQQTYVPDDNFEQALIELGYDNILDNYVSTNNISRITYLDVSSKEISNLIGIEAFVALKKLNCNFNDIQTLNLTSNTSLEELRCAFNKISDLEFDNNTTTLTYLDCGFNNVDDLEISNNLLSTLYCDYNSLSSLNLNSNNSITKLNCSYNNLTALNVKNGNNANFTYFDARNNPELSCIEVDNASYSTSNWPNKDSGTGYSNDCEGGSSPGLTYVPNNNFEQALIDLGHDDVLDDYVVTANISGVTTLNVSDRGISDMTGIEDFVSLVTLSCGSNGLGVLDFRATLCLNICTATTTSSPTLTSVGPPN
ncbi:leucine-rich repeat domain-containing protein [Tamlana crocina]